MELWIRTQNREALIKTNIIKWENGCLRGATDEDGWYQDLGKYKKKRALEVLDEIQNCIPQNFDFNGSYEEVDLKIKGTMINGLYGIIYEMPQE